MTINWNLADPARAASAAWEGFERGAALGDHMRRKREERELRGALADFSANPDDPDALREVMARDPQLGMKLAEYSDKRAFRAGVLEYVGGNALLGMGGQPTQGALSGLPGSAPLPQQAEQNAMLRASPATSGATVGGAPVPGLGGRNAMLQPAAPGASFGEAFAPYGEGSAQPAPSAAQQPEQPAADLSFLGRPQSRQDAAFLRMVQADPVEALKIQSAMRDNFVDRIKAEREFYAVAVEELSRVGDEAGWQRALQRVAPVAQALGADLSTIPQTYPGPDKVRELLEGALPVKERLDYFLREANLEADNLRADRNTDSLIADRERRREEQRRVNEARLGIQERGLGLRESDVEADNRRADAAAERSGRNTESLIRSRRDRSGGRSGGRTPARSAGANDDLPLVRTPAEARGLPKGTRFRTLDGRVKIVP